MYVRLAAVIEASNMQEQSCRFSVKPQGIRTRNPQGCFAAWLTASVSKVPEFCCRLRITGLHCIRKTRIPHVKCPVIQEHILKVAKHDIKRLVFKKQKWSFFQHEFTRREGLCCHSTKTFGPHVCNGHFLTYEMHRSGSHSFPTSSAKERHHAGLRKCTTLQSRKRHFDIPSPCILWRPATSEVRQMAGPVHGASNIQDVHLPSQLSHSKV
mmetsp:Transcript_35492/g.66102  ORF Transcript_35492/g.66102 Transcript_35492/m.66102 type:complete len:211 (+) Transcript_35492:677-1309(+)